eukprot:5374825-Amphidinium_carterae.1
MPAEVLRSRTQLHSLQLTLAGTIKEPPSIPLSSSNIMYSLCVPERLALGEGQPVRACASRSDTHVLMRLSARGEGVTGYLHGELRTHMQESSTAPSSSLADLAWAAGFPRLQ